MNKEMELGFQYKDKPDGFAQKISMIYQRLQDEESRRIFENRLLFSLTGDSDYMRNVILSTAIGRKMYESLLNKKDMNLYIYGAGMRGKRLVHLFPEIPWRGFIDERETGSYQKLPIFTMDALPIDEKTSVIISLFAGFQPVKEALLERGIEGSRLVMLHDFDEEAAENTYFDTECVGTDMEPAACFIDAGGFDGRDTLHYLERFFPNKRDQAKAIVFEPDWDNYEVCKKNLKSFAGVRVRNSGLGSENRESRFLTGRGEGSCFDDSGKGLVFTEALDVAAAGERVSFIKLDVEGCEEEAIRGAKGIIAAQAPRLAVSVYHKQSDIWRLPALILEINPDYAFYLRHYTVSYGDTVLYALKKAENKAR